MQQTQFSPDIEHGAMVYTCINFFNYFSVYSTTTPSSQPASEFQVATYSLTALATILIIIVIALALVICRMRPKDY